MLRYLIQSDDIGININIRNNEEFTALHMLDRNEMNDVGLSWYGYHATEEVPKQHTEVPQQRTASTNEWLKERLNTIMIVAALIAGISYQAIINPPGGVFQDDSEIDSTTNPLPPQNTTGNITADDEIVTYRSNFVKNLLTAANTYESFILLNSLSLLVCASTILIILLAIAVVCFGLSYTIVVKTIGPPFYRHHKLDIKLNIMGVGVMIIQFSLFVYCGISLRPHMRRRLRWLICKWMVFYLAIISLWAYFS
ncbi:hypothetical protein MKX03_027980 [Papaver bracteatum]|nr:hypothetical protein MKX03_027980 [Papaver bracteatum]